MLVARNYLPSNLVRLLPDSGGISAKANQILRREAWHGDHVPEPGHRSGSSTLDNPETTDPLYLFACQVEWERRADPSAAWEVISATRSSNQDTRAHARSLLERSQESKPQVPEDSSTQDGDAPSSTKEAGMRTPYGLDVIESCMGCKASREGFFCRFLTGAAEVSGWSQLPQCDAFRSAAVRRRADAAWGVCSLLGQSKAVHYFERRQSTDPEAGRGWGSVGVERGYFRHELRNDRGNRFACQLNFIGRQDLMTLLQNESEVGVHAAQSLSREFQGAYRDIHDLVLARSSSGKLARLLLSCAPQGNTGRATPAFRHDP